MTTPPDGTPGPALEVNRDDVLAKRNALLAEAQDFQQFLNRIQRDLFMEPCGGDPVSQDVANVVNHRLAGPDNNSYWNVCQAWIDNLYQTADALAETAKRYGFTDEEITDSLTRGGTSA